MAFLMDTCVWIDVHEGVLAPADVEALTQGDDVFMSPVTLAELCFGAEITRDPATRMRRLAALQLLERKSLLQIDGATGVIFGSLAAQIKAMAVSIDTGFKTCGLPARPCSTPADY